MIAPVLNDIANQLGHEVRRIREDLRAVTYALSQIDMLIKDLVTEPISESPPATGPIETVVTWQSGVPILMAGEEVVNRIQEPTRPGAITSAITRGVITDENLEDGDGERHPRQI